VRCRSVSGDREIGSGEWFFVRDYDVSLMLMLMRRGEEDEERSSMNAQIFENDSDEAATNKTIRLGGKDCRRGYGRK
jgi:hypothetical protein